MVPSRDAAVVPAGAVLKLGTEHAYAVPEDGIADVFGTYLAGAFSVTATATALVHQLLALEHAMQAQTRYRFYGSSVLFIYDGACVCTVVPCAVSDTGAPLRNKPGPCCRAVQVGVGIDPSNQLF